MTNEEGGAFLSIMMASKQDPKKFMTGTASEILASYAEKGGPPLPFAGQVYLKRFEALAPSVVLDEALMLMLLFFCKTPGDVVIYAYGVAQQTLKQGGEPVTLDQWATKLSPMGPPTENALHALWDRQKLPPPADNWLDLQEAYQKAG